MASILMMQCSLGLCMCVHVVYVDGVDEMRVSAQAPAPAGSVVVQEIRL